MFFILDYFLPFHPPNTQENPNFGKMKKTLEISFYSCVPKIMIRWCMAPEIWCTTDGCSNRKSNIKRWEGAPPKNPKIIIALISQKSSFLNIHLLTLINKFESFSLYNKNSQEHDATCNLCYLDTARQLKTDVKRNFPCSSQVICKKIYFKNTIPIWVDYAKYPKSYSKSLSNLQLLQISEWQEVAFNVWVGLQLNFKFYLKSTISFQSILIRH